MRSFLLPRSFHGEETLILAGNEYHYLIHVLRLQENDIFNGRDREGNLFSLQVLSVKKQSLTLLCSPLIEQKSLILPEITLYQCICKGKKMDRIIRQATETGVKTIVPLFSEYTVPRKDGKEGKHKQTRWNKIIREALQQSGSPVMTEIREPCYLTEINKTKKNSEIKLFFHQSPLENHSLHEYLCTCPEEVSLLVGPEGGLSSEETRFLTKAGFDPVLLKTNILRAETAAIYALGAVQCILTEYKHWQLAVH